MHKEYISNLLDTNLSIEELIKKINLETDIKDFFEIAISKGREVVAIEFVEYLLENGNKNIADMIQILRDFGIGKQILKEKQELFLKTFKGKEIIEYINGCKEYEGITEEYTIQDLVRSIYQNDKIARDEQTLYIIERLITEVAQTQGLNPLDINFAGSGVYSKNYKIGEFVLKVGFPRETRKIPYHKRIMQPIIRQETNRNASDKNPNICVELQNVGDPTWYEQLSEKEIKEELYKIYSELRDDGIYWLDIKADNVVRLLKPNKLNLRLDGEEIGRNEDSVEMIGLKEEEPLDAGELVIADTDFIYSKKDSYNIYRYLVPFPVYDMFLEFTKRYNKEHNYIPGRYDFEPDEHYL